MSMNIVHTLMKRRETVLRELKGNRMSMRVQQGPSSTGLRKEEFTFVMKKASSDEQRDRIVY